ncbi:hypothetical protein FJY63_00955 [Candidatus Sumerlaeota bacterium]|nr:hypothetical protein [Candidatus Sumerlaeota bacterium]
METKKQGTTDDKVTLFRQCFTGLTHVYGTYDPATGCARQVKASVTLEQRAAA